MRMEIQNIEGIQMGVFWCYLVLFACFLSNTGISFNN